MSQHDMDLANGSGAGFRADINLAIKALASNNSGASEPPVTYPGMPWADFSGSIPVLKIRNAADTDWIVVPIQQSATNIASAATIDLTDIEVVGAKIATVTGTTPTSEILMNDGDVMTLVAAAAWVLTNTATTCEVVGGANYTCKAGELIRISKTGGVVTLTPENFASGQGQTWQDVIGSRASGTNYTNSTGRTIHLSVTSATPISAVYVDGVIAIGSAVVNLYSALVPVPPGGVYSVASAVSTWKELR